MIRMPKNFKEMEQYLTYIIFAATALFILFLIVAGIGIVWLKIVLAVLGILLSAAVVGYLYLTKELLKRRSMWMTTAACAIAVCLFISLILNFPSPNKYKPAEEKESAYTSSYYINK